MNEKYYLAVSWIEYF